MDQDIEIINSNTRYEKIKNFLINYKKQLITIIVIIILGLFSYFFYEDYKSSKKEELANKYNLTVIKYNSDQKENVETIFREIVNAKDKTYSPLAFYFLLDNELIDSKEEINNYFDILINDLGLDKEIQNLTIFK